MPGLFHVKQSVIIGSNISIAVLPPTGSGADFPQENPPLDGMDGSSSHNPRQGKTAQSVVFSLLAAGALALFLVAGMEL